ncbi:hypothetical protein JYQ62_06275 [Nostoc sp. UHCC 0702]|nr:hypothetical protein JYQ62_06275 [Nostoc sp. UHCC 0702]
MDNYQQVKYAFPKSQSYLDVILNQIWEFLSLIKADVILNKINQQEES